MEKQTWWQRFKHGFYVNFFDALNIFAAEDKFIHSHNHLIHRDRSKDSNSK